MRRGRAREREKSFLSCEFLEHGLDCAARTFRRTSRSTSLLRNTPSSSPGSILERGYLPTPLRPPRLVRWCTKGRALRVCEESLSRRFSRAPIFEQFSRLFSRGVALKLQSCLSTRQRDRSWFYGCCRQSRNSRVMRGYDARRCKLSITRCALRFTLRTKLTPKAKGAPPLLASPLAQVCCTSLSRSECLTPPTSFPYFGRTRASPLEAPLFCSRSPR